MILMDSGNSLCCAALRTALCPVQESSMAAGNNRANPQTAYLHIGPHTHSYLESLRIFGVNGHNEAVLHPSCEYLTDLM